MFTIPIGHRQEAVEWELVDRDTEAHVAPLDTVAGSGEIFESVYTDTQATGSVRVHDPHIAWHRYRVRPWAVINGERYPLGVYIATTPVVETTATGQSATVKLYDKTLIARRASYGASFSLDTGTVVTDAVRAILASMGITQAAITESAERLTAPMVWGPENSKLRIINDLLMAVNYFGLYCDPHGVYTVAPYVAPQYRPIIADYVDGHTCYYRPEFSRELDTFEVPNKVVYISQPTDGGDTPGLVSVAINDDPTSPFSRPNVGEITKWVENVEATSQAALDGLAARDLAEASTVAAKIQIEAAFQPHPLHAAVEFANRRTGMTRRRVTITEKRTRLQTPILQQVTLREVAV